MIWLWLTPFFATARFAYFSSLSRIAARIHVFHADGKAKFWSDTPMMRQKFVKELWSLHDELC
jgi:hypothetical protein